MTNLKSIVASGVLALTGCYSTNDNTKRYEIYKDKGYIQCTETIEEKTRTIYLVGIAVGHELVSLKSLDIKCVDTFPVEGSFGGCSGPVCW